MRARHMPVAELPAPPQRITLQPELIVRRSCGCAAAEKDDEAIVQPFF
jgi:hypothetical protein